jgi:two-component system response regulator
MSAATSSRTILLIEDDPDDAELAIRALRGNRIPNDIVHVKDGAAARDFLFGVGEFAGRDPAEAPALILLDLKLPKISGLDVLRRIRADDHTRLTPVVILTSSDEEEDMIRGYGLGANSFVRKPVNFEEFMEKVRDTSVYWLSINETP